MSLNYTYNADGLVTGELFADGSSYSFTYDGHGNLLTATDATGTITFAYDYPSNPNLLTDVLCPDGTFLKFTYNIVGQRTQSVDQTGFTVNYTYDSVGRLSKLADASGNLIVQYAYDAAGKLIQKDMGNGTRTVYTYDGNGNVLSIVNLAPDHATINSFDDYTYDELGNVLTDTNQDGQWIYTCDADSQLIGANFTPNNPNLDGLVAQHIQYVYDPAGNRISETVNGVITAYAVNSVNEYTSSATNGLTTSYQYDADSNLITQTDSSGTTNYTFNDLNQLIGVNGPSLTAGYGYDPLGNLVSQTIDGATTNYQVDPTGLGNVVAAFDGSGASMAHYTYGLGLTSQVSASGGASYYDYSNIGSTLGITGADGSYVSQYSYLPFGQTLTINASLANPFTYVGQLGVVTAGGGKYIMRYRVYDVLTGSFLSDDPLGLSGGDPDVRLYVSNNPVTLVDPSGLSFTEWWQNYHPIEECRQKMTQQGIDYLKTLRQDTGNPWLQKLLGKTIQDLEKLNAPSKILLPKPTASPAPPGDPGNSTGGDNGGGGCGCQCPPTNPPDLPSNNGPNGGPNINVPQDPNNIVGPVGFGDPSFIALDQVLPYTIDFENEPAAGVPAQQVIVTQQLDANLNWQSFRLGSFGFGGMVFQIPANSAFYQTQIDLTQQDGFYVDVSATIDERSGIATWFFTTIDPNTGEIPLDPTLGFLPPDNPSGIGEGFVTYTVMANQSDATGTIVKAQATVTFYTQPPLNTAQILNTIDAGTGLTSAVAPLPALETSPEFNVSWSGSDAPHGSAIRNFTILVSADGGPFTAWLTDTALSGAPYMGQPGHTYAFYSIATDNAGNVEAPPSQAQATTFVQGLGQTTTTTALASDQPSGAGYGQAVTFTATVSSAGSSGSIPAGTVQFLLDGTNIGNPTALSSGSATITVYGLVAGTHAVTAAYTGDNNFLGSNGTLGGGQSVNPAPLTITADNQIMTYGGSVPTLTVSYTGFVNGDTSASFTALPIIGSTVTSSSSVGSYSITASGAVDPNYTISYVAGLLTVTPAPLVINVASTSKTYGTDDIASLTGTVLGILNSDPITATYASAGSAAAASAAGGPYTINATLADGGTGALGNYNITINPGALTISPYTPTVTASGTVTYNGNAQAATPSATGVGSSDPTPTGTYTLTYSGNGYGPSTTGPTNAGTYSVAVSFVSTDANYSNSTGTGSLTVSPYGFTYQIGNDTQTYGTPANLAHDLGTTINTGVNSENLDIAYSSTGDTATAAVGTYPITGTLSNGTGQLSNYNVMLVNGTLTVNSATVTAGTAGPPDGVLYQPRIFTFTASGGPGDAAAGFTYVINWGDGNPVQTVLPTANNTTIAESHAYTASGTFTVAVTATDQFGVTSPAVKQTITIGLAEVQADSTGQGGFTGLAISGTSAAQGVVLAPGTTAYSIKITRGGTLLGTFVPTGGNIAIYGDGGTDLVTVTGVVSSADTFTLSGSTATFTAASLSPNVFTITLNNIGTVTFQGGNSGNSFTNTAATVASTLIGGTGTNTYTFAGNSMGAATTIQGKGSNNTLTGPTLASNQTNVWTVSGTNAGNLNGTNWTFTGVQNLIGGANDDRFKFVGTGSLAGSVNGGGNFSAAGDTLDYSSDAAATIAVNLQTSKATGIGGTYSNIETIIGQTSPSTPDTLTGPNIASAWSVTGANSGTVNAVNFANFGNLTGGTAADTFTLGANGSLTGTLNGGGSSNTLVGPNLASTFDIRANNAGNLANTSGVFNFTSIQNLTGGSQPNVFVFSAGVSIGGNVSNGTLNDASYTTNVSVNLQTNKVTGVGGTATNLAGATGGTGTNTLTGANTNNTWNITGANVGNLNGTFAFAAFANLDGGSVNDDFAFFPGGSISGIVNGEAPVNTLNYSQYGSPVTVNLQTKTATGIAGTWANIQDFIGTATTDTLIGPNAASTWNITGANNGTVNTYTFAGFSNLTGGTGTNTLTVSNSGSLSGNLTGTGSANTLVGPNAASTFNITGSNAGNINSTVIHAFSGIQNLTGGTSPNVFVFGNSAGVTGNLNGGTGGGTLNYASYTTSVTVSLQTKRPQRWAALRPTWSASPAGARAIR